MSFKKIKDLKCWIMSYYVGIDISTNNSLKISNAHCVRLNRSPTVINIRGH